MAQKLPDTRGRYRSDREAEYVQLCFKPDPMPRDECVWDARWVRDASDQRVVDDGTCWIDPLRGGYAVWWIERYMRLYQGRWAGEPAQMIGCKDCRECWTIPREFDPAWAVERMESFLACRESGHALSWQYDFVFRLFGWVRYSDELEKVIRRYRAGDVWIPKKNAKTPVLAFIGWYLTVGDGVMGQNVYFGAKDGSQAREMVGGSAVAAWEESPEIQSSVQYKINEMLFTHPPTKSRMKPLSSSNQRTTKSKEGINGSVLIDEVHVVDDEFMSRIKRAGISREEPLVLGVSTAGLETTGYGKKRQDYGRRVADGELLEDGYLYVCYEAPQDIDVGMLTDEEVIEIGKAANPSWGVTILQSEFLSDFHQSRDGSLDELMDFATYRLNIWQNTSSPWLRSSDWDKCAGDFTLEDLAGMPCTLGLDMSRTRDMTAACFVFDADMNGKRPIWPMFWIPENTARRHQKNVAGFLDWQRQGLVNLTEADTISHAQVLSDIVAVLEVVGCENVYYDPTFADWLTEQLEQVYGIARIQFKQSLVSYAAPTDQFEAEVLDGTILHPAHEILDWQVGHCHVYRNRFTKMKRPIKPDDDSNDPRTIDGVAATVMGYVRAVDAEETVADINPDLVML